MKKHIGLVFSILFFLFAALQYNDPDPWIWIAIYGIVSVVAFLQWRGRVSDKALQFLAVCFLVATVSYTPELLAWAEQGFPNIAGEMKTENPHIELIRESLGLAIAGAALFYLYRISKSKNR